MDKLKIVYEDNHIVVADKPSGVLSQGDYSGETSLLDMIKEYVRVKYNKPGEAYIGLVHRLDRPVSGLLVFARTSKAAERLQKEFISGRIKKFYLAVIESSSSIDEKWHRLENFMERERDITRIVKKGSDRTDIGILYYHPLLKGDKHTLVLIKLDTGKKHQIRAQFSGIDAPVAGDTKYGSGINTGKGICLHSAYLSFIHPTSKTEMEFYSPPPSIFRNLIEFEDNQLKEKVSDLAKNFPSGQLVNFESLQ